MAKTKKSTKTTKKTNLTCLEGGKKKNSCSTTTKTCSKAEIKREVTLLRKILCGLKKLLSK